jgi:hypothetical protein
MTTMDDARISGLLGEVATRATWPATPDLRAAVVARIEREGLQPGMPSAAPAVARVPARPSGPVGRTTRRPVLRAGRALVFAVVALLVLAGVAAALGIRLPGIDILFVERVPPAGAGLDLGTQVTLDEALALDQPRVRVPDTRPRPDAAFVTGTGDRRIVTLAYRAPEGQPTLAGSDLDLTVMAVPGTTNEQLLAKLLGPGTTIEPVLVGRLPGWWITGAPHEIVFRQPDGAAAPLASALAGDTLLFSREGTLYRLESALGRDATIAIAASME